MPSSSPRDSHFDLYEVRYYIRQNIEDIYNSEAQHLARPIIKKHAETIYAAIVSPEEEALAEQLPESLVLRRSDLWLSLRLGTNLRNGRTLTVPVPLERQRPVPHNMSASYNSETLSSYFGPSMKNHLERAAALKPFEDELHSMFDEHMGELQNFVDNFDVFFCERDFKTWRDVCVKFPNVRRFMREKDAANPAWDKNRNKLKGKDDIKIPQLILLVLSRARILQIQQERRSTNGA